MKTKYGFEFQKEQVVFNNNRLINQIYKLIPMRENHEDWKKQLDVVILEISGLNTIFNTNKNYLTLLSKLEGLNTINTDFDLFRKTVFDSINLIKEVNQ